MKKISLTIKERIKKLRALVEYHRLKYHTDDAPEISDEAYDALIRELESLESTEDSTSPTQKVGGFVLDKFVKVRHEVPQWSYDNIFDYDGLVGWIEKTNRFISKSSVARTVLANDKVVEYITELKIDGMKIILT